MITESELEQGKQRMQNLWPTGNKTIKQQISNVTTVM